MNDTMSSPVDGARSGEAGQIDPISLMIARFAAAVELGKDLDDGLLSLETIANLEFLFTTLAATQLDLLGPTFLMDTKNHPGHLIARVEERAVYVPFHLAE